MQIMTTTIEAGIVILSPCFPLFGPENPNHSKHSMDCVTGNAYTQAYPDSRARILPPRHVELGTRRSPPPLSLFIAIALFPFRLRQASQMANNAGVGSSWRH